MQISKKSEYATLGVLYIVLRGEKALVKVDQVVRDTNIPKPILLKIFNALVKTGILKSKSGFGGGYSLACHPQELTLLDVLKIFERTTHMNACTADTPCKLVSQCGMASIWKHIQKDVDNIFRKVTFAKLISNSQSNFLPKLPLKKTC